MKIQPIMPYEIIRASEISDTTLIIPSGKEDDDVSLVELACDLLEDIGTNFDMFG